MDGRRNALPCLKTAMHHQTRLVGIRLRPLRRVQQSQSTASSYESSEQSLLQSGRLHHSPSLPRPLGNLLDPSRIADSLFGQLHKVLDIQRRWKPGTRLVASD